MSTRIQRAEKKHFDDFLPEVEVLKKQYIDYVESQSRRFQGFLFANRQMKRRWQEPYGPLCYYVPFWYSHVFNIPISKEVRTIASANFFMYHYFTIKDDLIDHELEAEPAGGFISDLLFGKSIELYLQSNVDGPSFLVDLNRYLGDALEAEMSLNQHKGTVTAYSDADFIMMGQKAALLKTSAAALSGISNDGSRLKRLEEVLLAISIGIQLTDDLIDWRHDFRVRNFTFPLVKAITALGTSSIDTIKEEDICRMLFSQLIGLDVLTCAKEYFNRAKELLYDLDSNYLCSFVDGYIADISVKQQEIQEPSYKWKLGDVILGRQLHQS